MNIFPTKFEVYFDDFGADLMGTLEAFDDTSFSLVVNDKIVGPDDLRALADLLEKAELLLSNGLNKLSYQACANTSSHSMSVKEKSEEEVPEKRMWSLPEEEPELYNGSTNAQEMLQDFVNRYKSSAF